MRRWVCPRSRRAVDVSVMLLRPSVVKACGVALLVAAAMDLVTLLTTTYAPPAVRGTYVVMIAGYLSLSVLLRIRMQPILTDPTYSERFARTAWAVVAIGLMTRLGMALFSAPDLVSAGDAVLSSSIGLIVLYLLAFILFDRFWATVTSVATMAVAIALVAVRMAAEAEPTGLGTEVLAYGRAFTVHVIVLIYLYVLARSKEVLNESHHATTALTIAAGTDELTGLPNRRQLGTVLNSTIDHSRTTAQPLAVVVADLDRFKLVNDTHGHACGDDILQHTATLLRRAIRDEDVVGRWGGEEFLLVLPGADEQTAAGVAERCRDTLGSQHSADVGTVTASFGIAVLLPQDDVESVIARADDALYRAKALGRNRVVIAPPTPSPAPRLPARRARAVEHAASRS